MTGLSTPTAIIYDQWVEIEVIVDITNNLYSASYNGTQIMRENAWQTGGASQMRCLDLYNGGAGTFYYDDVLIDIIGGCGTCCPFDTLSCVSDCASDSVSLDWSSFQTGAIRKVSRSAGMASISRHSREMRRLTRMWV